MDSLKNFLCRLKDDNPYLKYIWLQTAYRRQWKINAKLSDVDCINNLYKGYCGHLPNLDNPVAFSEKMQWLKLHYRNELMPIVGDKYTVRKYLEELGYGNLLNSMIAVFESIDEFDIDKLPNQFVLKATHSSGWNLVVRDKNKINWSIWKRHMQYWLSHDIAWNGREWHYGVMTPRIVCEKYLEDKSGGLMDYKFYCFNGEPQFMQLNVDRGLASATQNYYDLDWKLLPFGKTHAHNPNIHPQKPEKFDEMVSLARKLSKPFPYVRMDFYEANGRIYFGEFTFFPCSGMPDFIPSEYDCIVGKMLKLPIANQ
jgi:hypothetical protein